MPEKNINYLEVLPHPDAYLDRWKEYQVLSEKALELERQIDLLNQQIEKYRESDEEKYQNVFSSLPGFVQVLNDVNIKKQLAYNAFGLAVKTAQSVRNMNKVARGEEDSNVG